MPDGQQPVDLSDDRWLSVLIDEAIDAAARAPRSTPVPPRLNELDHELVEALWSRGLLVGGIPEEKVTLVRGESEAELAFIQTVRFVLTEAAALLLARASLQNSRPQLRWQLGSFAAGLCAEYGVAVVLEEAVHQRQLAEDDERRLLSVAGRVLASRAYLLGNPAGGLPLHAAMTAFEARAFIRLAAAQVIHGGPLRRRAERFVGQLSLSKALFVELMAGVLALATASEAAPAWPRIAGRQVRALSLLWGNRRLAREALRSPRPPAVVLGSMPLRLRRLMVEQLVFASLLARQWSPAVRAFVREAGTTAGLDARELDLMESRSAAFLIQHEKAALALSASGEQNMLDTALNAASDSMHEAAEGIAREIQETGELGLTLARLARGEALTREERARMRLQLIDLAKVVPSLAILAAPGGTLLLPLILKLLPWDLRPSTFQSRPPRPRSAGKPGSSDAA